MEDFNNIQLTTLFYAYVMSTVVYVHNIATFEYALNFAVKFQYSHVTPLTCQNCTFDLLVIHIKKQTHYKMSHATFDVKHVFALTILPYRGTSLTVQYFIQPSPSYTLPMCHYDRSAAVHEVVRRESTRHTRPNDRLMAIRRSCWQIIE